MNRPQHSSPKKEAAPQTALLEIGTEEIPASYIPPALEFMKSFAENFVNAKRLACQSITHLGTPRRLTILIAGLPSKSEAQTEEMMGPSIKAARNENNEWTQAAKGFAQSQKVPIEELQIRSTKKGDYVFAVKKHEGMKTETILKELFSELIPAIPFPKKMLWNESKFRFARPIRNLAAIYGTKTIPLNFAGVKSTNKTFGLSHVQGSTITLHSHNYIMTLKNHCILADPEARKKTIVHSANQLANRLKGQLKMDEGLLEEVVWLIEHPTAVLGSFDSKFLELPQEVLRTCMKKHQKFFTIIDEHGKMMPHFVAIRNGISEHQETVRKGYEKVLNARLVDAEFFFHEDLKKPLETHLQKSREITLQEKLGTVGDKIIRMKKIVQHLIETEGNLSQSNGSAAIAGRAVELCKFDLATSMVYEFPELQGAVGEIYASRYGENSKVCQAIREHYYPTTNQGELPTQTESCLVAIADKIDTLAGNFLIGLTPTGSADPYGLRRHSTGLLKIILQQGWTLDLSDLIQCTLNQFPSALLPAKDTVNLSKDLLNFLAERFQLLMLDAGYSQDEIFSITKNGGDPDSARLMVTNLKEKIAAVHSVRSHPDFDAIATAFKRTANILKQSKAKSIPASPDLFSETLLQQPAEIELHQTVKSAAEKTQSLLKERKYQPALQELVTIRGSLDQFFEKVLVMDPDESLRRNRLSLLAILESHFKQIADFSLIQPKPIA